MQARATHTQGGAHARQSRDRSGQGTRMPMVRAGRAGWFNVAERLSPPRTRDGDESACRFWRIEISSPNAITDAMAALEPVTIVSSNMPRIIVITMNNASQPAMMNATSIPFRAVQMRVGSLLAP